MTSPPVISSTLAPSVSAPSLVSAAPIALATSSAMPPSSVVTAPHGLAASEPDRAVEGRLVLFFYNVI